MEERRYDEEGTVEALEGLDIPWLLFLLSWGRGGSGRQDCGAQEEDDDVDQDRGELPEHDGALRRHMVGERDVHGGGGGEVPRHERRQQGPGVGRGHLPPPGEVRRPGRGPEVRDEVERADDGAADELVKDGPDRRAGFFLIIISSIQSGKIRMEKKGAGGKHSQAQNSPPVPSAPSLGGEEAHDGGEVDEEVGLQQAGAGVPAGGGGDEGGHELGQYPVGDPVAGPRGLEAHPVGEPAGLHLRQVRVEHARPHRLVPHDPPREGRDGEEEDREERGGGPGTTGWGRGRIVLSLGHREGA